MAERPCLKKHPTPVPDECDWCRLYLTRRSYFLLWGGTPEEWDKLIGREPGIARKVINFGQAVVKQVKNIGRNGFWVPPEVKAARLAICEACDMFKPKERECRKCGCKLDTKAGWSSQECPLKPPKWGEYEKP